MSSIARQVIEAIVTRLQSISTASGYNTDAGLYVFSGIVFDTDLYTYPLLNVVFGGEASEMLTYNRSRIVMTVTVDAYTTANADVTIAVLDLIQDINRAIEQPDVTIGGLVQAIEYDSTDPGEPFESGRGQNVRVNYSITYDRDYGA